MKKTSILLAGLLSFTGGLLPAVQASQAPNQINWASRWQHLPETPAPVAGIKSSYADINGIKLYYGTLGHGSPVILVHGGLANSDYWGKQIPVLAKNHQVIIVDSRGHGRSTRNSQEYGYDLMTDDIVALMDHLKLKKADIVGWSDGGIIGIDMAIHHPERVNKVFSFAPNTKTSGVKSGVENDPVFGAYIKRAGDEYKKLSKTPTEYDAFVDQISHMWASQPNWSDADLQKIKTPILIVDGDHDEAIVREHLEYIAKTIPGAGLLILPNSSHFAFIQAPKEFNDAIVNFLDN
ncbi:alpha/beta hydrolase [Cedecea neteri]|uniref:alpha/beta fold hydrolase n=1 Tax=Cedecea neteri TaxID=158822 RepID=UPI0028931D0A|nr:alpha/beta hydrolase [Cedecea neteri]WNJ81584.1 alpha/beta hydrolase [Cedecea neteri]